MSTSIARIQEKQNRKSVNKRLLRVSPIAMLAASIANLGLYTVAGYFFPEVTAWSGASVAQIIGANIVYLLIGTITFAIINVIASRPARTFLIVASIGLLFSLALPISAGFGFGPPGTPPASTATVMTLSLMHLISFAISVPLFNRLALD